MIGGTSEKTVDSISLLRSSSSTSLSMGESSTSSVNNHSLEPCCSVAVSTTDLTSPTLPRGSEPTYQSTNGVLSMGATDPAAPIACPSQPTDLPVVVVDRPKHSPGSLPPYMEEEEYMNYVLYLEKFMEMARYDISLPAISNIATLLTPAVHRQQQQTAGVARCPESRGSIRLSLPTDRHATGLQSRDADGCVNPAMDENGDMDMSYEVRKTCVSYS